MLPWIPFGNFPDTGKSVLELSCEAGDIKMTMASKLGHPDKLHFPPPPDSFIKNKSPSMIRRQERRKMSI